MILPCEVAAKSVVPAIKAFMAKKLVEEHGMKQDQVAEILCISQSAVSKYSHNIRGYSIRVDRVEGLSPLVNDMVALVTNETYKRTCFIQLFCQACATIRRTRAMCPLCLKSDAKINIQQCDFCTSLKL